MILQILTITSRKKISWEAWLKNLKKDLEKERFKKSTIQILDNITFNSKVIEYDRKQPEFKLNFLNI